MIRRIYFAVFVISVVTVSQQLAVDDRTTFSDAETVCDDTCKKIGKNFAGNDGKITFHQIEDCGSNYCTYKNGGYICDKEIGSCIPVSKSIKCKSNGKFPDLKNCSQYYECEIDKVADPIPCHEYKYNPCTEECDRDIKECPDTKEGCAKAGELNVIKENQRLYYFCVKENNQLMLEMYRCPTGFFNVSTGSCDKSNSENCVKTISDGVSPAVSPSTDSPTTSTQAFTECTHYGYFEDQNDRHRYYFCDAVLHKFHYTCPTKICFDPNSGKCVKDSC